MRIATFILGIGLVVAMGLQSCSVYGLASIGESMNSSGATKLVMSGVSGILATVAAFVAMAFVLPFPRVAALLYLLAALLALMAERDGFKDMLIWAIALFVLTLFSLLAHRQRRSAVTTA